MSTRTPRAHRCVLFVIALSLCVTGGLVPAASAVPPVPVPVAGPTAQYVVALTRPPLASYPGGTAGIPATRPAAGARVASDSEPARRYIDLLATDQDEVAATVGAGVGTRFHVAFNGFTAELTREQAAALSGTPGVLSVTRDALHYATEDTNSVDFLKLSGATGVWSTVGGPANAGNGVVVGVIDSGIWPENPSFDGEALAAAPDRDHPNRAYRNDDDIVMTKANGQQFIGACETGEEFTPNDCNTKIVSARYFGQEFIDVEGVDTLVDYVSPRDGAGHGTHVAGTAAGTAGVDADVDGIDFGQISGVAPGASIAVYKALWKVNDQPAAGFTSDIVAAIDQAVKDGIDVLNFSAGGSPESSPVDPIALAFLSAASAGIFVSAAAGNSGPVASTADNTQPWVTTVAASTIGPREGTAELGNGLRFSGASATVTAPVGPAPLVAGRLSGLDTASADDAALCTPQTLDPELVTGAIVQCDRGVVDRVEKSAEVARAGGIGMILTNVSTGSIDSDMHSVPTVHLSTPAGWDVANYAQSPNATATLVPGNTTGETLPYPQLAAFSSRGPSLQSKQDILKPDLTAPGVGILAAVAPPSNSDRRWDFYSGTSMAAPHVSGLAAIYKQQRPGWSPMAIKSALMTTAYNTRNPDGTANLDPFAQGAGQVDPTRMLNPALVYDAGPQDWLGYLEGVGISTGTGVPTISPSDYNQASIAAGELLGPVRFTRTVTAVTPGFYWAEISVPGVDAVVSPSIIYLAEAGDTKEFVVTLAANGSGFDSYATGYLTWHGAGTTVRSPVAVVPKAVSSEADLVEIPSGTSTTSWTVTPGTTGDFPITAYGMVDGDPQQDTVTENSQVSYTVQVPDGTKIARFSARLDEADTGADVILAVTQLTDSGEEIEVGLSDSGANEEIVDLRDPVPGVYRVDVFGFFDAPETNGTPFSFRHFMVGSEPSNGSLLVGPADATTQAGQPVEVTALVSVPDPDQQYLGWVEYVDGSGTVVVANADR